MFSKSVLKRETTSVTSCLLSLIAKLPKEVPSERKGFN